MSVKSLGLWVRLILRIPTFSQYFASQRGGGGGCGLYPGKYGMYVCMYTLVRTTDGLIRPSVVLTSVSRLYLPGIELSWISAGIHNSMYV